MRMFESLSRVMVACAAVTFTWSCDSGTSSKEQPPAGGAGGTASGGAEGKTTPASAAKETTPASAAKETTPASAAKAPPPPAIQEAPAPAKKEEPQYVTVQHILISFTGKLPGRNIARTQEEARTLAEDLLRRAKAGEDFDALVREYTDDSHPGIYRMSNHGVQAPPGGYARGGMVAAFGDVGFPLEVGGIGMAAYDARKSPYGWHIIKRTE
jgi:hypothetical protein